MTEDVDLAGAALMLHRSYDWFVANWRRLRDDRAFPAPFIGGEPRSRPWWKAAAIEAWKAGAPPATGGNHAQPADAGTAANDTQNTPISPASADLARQLVAAAGGSRLAP